MNKCCICGKKITNKIIRININDKWYCFDCGEPLVNKPVLKWYK